MGESEHTSKPRGRSRSGMAQNGNIDRKRRPAIKREGRETFVDTWRNAKGVTRVGETKKNTVSGRRSMSAA